MNKPKEPRTTKLVSEDAECPISLSSFRPAALSDFLDWIKEVIPVDAVDVGVSIVSGWYYDDSSPSLYVSWKVSVPNERYQSQLKRYHKQLG